MKKLMLCPILSILFFNAYSQDTTCTYFVGNVVYEFNYQTSEIISEDIHKFGLYTIKIKEGDVLCLDFSDTIPCTRKVVTTYSDGEEDIVHLDANGKVYYSQDSILRVQVGRPKYE